MTVFRMFYSSVTYISEAESIFEQLMTQH